MAKKEVKKEELKEQEVEKSEPTPEEKYQLLKEDYDKLKDKYLRNVAEFENFRKRTLSEKSTWIKNATERLVLKVCDVLDNFERALSMDEKGKKKQFEAFKKGVLLIYSQLEDILKKEGVQKIAAMKEDFDPKYHEALSHIPSDYEENKVVAIIQNGYKMNDKLIRPALVAVSNGKKPEKKEKKK